MFYVYGLCEPGSAEVRYVGLTPRLKKRFQEHCRDFRLSIRKSSWLRDLLNSGRFPEMVILERSDTRDLALEARWIERLRAEGHRLTNMEDVIRENLTEAASRPKSAATRAKIGNAHRGITKDISPAGLASLRECGKNTGKMRWAAMSRSERSEYMRRQVTPAMLAALDAGRQLRHSR